MPSSTTAKRNGRGSRKAAQEVVERTVEQTPESAPSAPVASPEPVAQPVAEATPTRAGRSEYSDAIRARAAKVSEIAGTTYGPNDIAATQTVVHELLNERNEPWTRDAVNSLVHYGRPEAEVQSRALALRPNTLKPNRLALILWVLADFEPGGPFHDDGESVKAESGLIEPSNRVSDADASAA